MKCNETLKVLAMCFGEIEELIAIISERLHGSNIPFKAMFVEHWPVFINDPITYKIYNGAEHVKAIAGLCAVPIMLTSNDILEIVKRKEILMRKFS